jgi:hypothetical protein
LRNVEGKMEAASVRHLPLPGKMIIPEGRVHLEPQVDEINERCISAIDEGDSID